MPDSFNWDLIAKYVAGECSETEKKEMEGWLAEDPRHKILIDKFISGWRMEERDMPEIDSEKLWNELAVKTGIGESQLRSENSSIFRGGHSVLKYAAIITLAMLLPLMYFAFEYFSIEEVIYSVPFGQSELVQLPDGSSVTLDAGSQIIYSQNFGTEEREIFLSGEGFFEVTHNPEIPFIVNFNKGSVKVLGTKFNVSTWPETKRVEVVVREGRVALSNKKEKVVLTKGLSAGIDEEGILYEPENIDVDKYLGWMKKMYYFNEVPLKEILARFSRWFDVEIQLDDQTFGEERLNLYLENKNLEEALELLSLLTNLKYTITGKTVRLESGVTVTDE